MGIEYCHKSRANAIKHSYAKNQTSACAFFSPERFSMHSQAIFYPASLPPGAILWPARRKTARACTESARNTFSCSRVCRMLARTNHDFCAQYKPGSGLATRVQSLGPLRIFGMCWRRLYSA